MTNSPPANVKTEYPEDYQILASGIDTLYLALDGYWDNDSVFKYLDDLKEKAKNPDDEIEGVLRTQDGSQEWKFNIKPHGSKGFSWILMSNDYVLKIGRWLRPQSRPNIMIEIRSEALWRLGAQGAVGWILGLLLGIGVFSTGVKPSRVDFCVDMVVPSDMWSERILDYIVTRAKDMGSYRTGTVFTGVSIGRGDIIARIYDKAFEVINKSKKLWMFDVWKIDQQVPDDKKIIRIEFQLRRIVIKEFVIDTIRDLFKMESSVWTYLATNWLKFQDRPGTHHTQRSDLEWWQKVQCGYHGSQNANPAVRLKAAILDKRKLALQMYGLMSSLQAVELEQNSIDIDHRVKIDDCLHTFLQELVENGKDLEDLNNKIKRKRPKHQRPEEGGVEI